MNSVWGSGGILVNGAIMEVDCVTNGIWPHIFSDHGGPLVHSMQ